MRPITLLRLMQCGLCVLIDEERQQPWIVLLGVGDGVPGMLDLIKCTREYMIVYEI